MTTIDIASTAQPALALRYTEEELAVLADLYELEALPGLSPVPMSSDARGLATRTLLARNIIVIRDDDALEVTQPHATFLAAMFEAPVALRVSQVSGTDSVLSTWFDWGDECVGVHPEDDGAVYVAAYKGGARSVVLASLGVDGISSEKKDVDADLVVEVVTTTRNGDEFTVEHEAIGRSDGRWYQVSRA